MTTIDIRDDARQMKITEIVFADNSPDIEHHDVVIKLVLSDIHPRYFFVENFAENYKTFRRSDLDNLIKALQKAKELGWGDNG